MRVLVYRTSSFEPLELSVDSDITIEALKKLLPESDTRAVADGARLIYGGLVLLDSSRLSELACCSEPRVCNSGLALHQVSRRVCD